LESRYVSLRLQKDERDFFAEAKNKEQRAKNKEQRAKNKGYSVLGTQIVWAIANLVN